MSFFVSESLKGLLTEDELIEKKDSDGSVFDVLSAVIGNDSDEYFFEIKNYFVDSGIIAFNVSSHYLEKLFFDQSLMIKKIVLGNNVKEINYKFNIKKIQKQKNDIDYEIEIMF